MKNLQGPIWQISAIASYAGYGPKENGCLVRELRLHRVCKKPMNYEHWWQFGGKFYGSRACRGRYRTID